MSSSVQSFTYLRSSALLTGDGTPHLSLETCGGLTSHGLSPFPRFFAGFLTAPEAAAGGLLAVADVAATRYYQPQNRAWLDPVVTGNGDRLRFESFSGCGGVYARLDVLPDGIDGEMLGTGTTNVDVNAPLREALSMVGGSDPLHVAVGPDDVTVTTFDGPIVEKKVPLPDRWLRGFAEVQVLASRFDQRAELSAVEAVRFLRSLPRNNRQVLWVRPAGRTLRAAPGPSAGAVCLAGPDRLRALSRILRHAKALRVYGPAVAAGSPVASAWEVELPGMRLTLTVSPDAARGFSGEGAVLESLATDEAAADADLVSALLAWEPRVEVGDLARDAGLDPERVRAALVRLGTAGRIGYDVAEAAYFHRELPYDTGRVERMNPRLRDARALVDGGFVAADAEGGKASVRSGETTYQVRLAGDGTCTCEWWAKHRGGRGPCKHVLAAQIVTRRNTAGGARAGTEIGTGTGTGR